MFAAHIDLLQGTCPLVKACSHKNWEAAQLLIRHSAQVNNADREVGINTSALAAVDLNC